MPPGRHVLGTAHPSGTRVSRPPDGAHPQRPSASSGATIAARSAAALDDYRRSGLSHVVVTHAGIIKAARVRSGEPEGWRSIDFGGMIRLPDT